MAALFSIGVDVGGTNTDAVVLQGDRVVSWSKQVTTPDVTTGVARAVRAVLAQVKDRNLQGTITRVNIGTTHFVNALVQRRDLVPVSVVRLCGTASRALPPFCDFPQDLKKVVCGSYHLVNGGLQFDGQEISSLEEEELRTCIRTIWEEGGRNVVIVGIFSPIAPQAQEEKVADLFRAEFPEVSLTLSHRVGQIGLLERENAAVLNECLKPLCHRTVEAFRQALNALGLTCPFYLTQNDGTLISAEQTLEFPVRTFASGPTNSMRGAAFLSDVEDAVVIDIGGTTSDVGCLMGGFPRHASTRVKVAGVSTNFRMPDVLSIGLGGGSIVRQMDGADRNETESTVQVGPTSTGYGLVREGLVFGGATLTATDVAVAAGLADLGDPGHVTSLDRVLVRQAVDRIHQMVEEAIDQVKLSGEDQPILLVGGGTILVDGKRNISGASSVQKPQHYQVANAVGAALGQVSGTVDRVVNLAQTTRDQAISRAKADAARQAVAAGAVDSSVEITEVSEVPLAYVPSNVTKVTVKAVGTLKDRHTGAGTDLADIGSTGTMATEQQMAEEDAVAPPPPAPPPASPAGHLPTLQETEPQIHPETGEWVLSRWDVECLAVGVGILGCGGGGSPTLGRLQILRAMDEGRKIRIIAPERLGTTPALTGPVAAVAQMGAPTIWIEKLFSGTETQDALQCVKDLYAAGCSNGQLPNIEDSFEVKQGDGVTYLDDYRPAQTDSDRQTDAQTDADGDVPEIVAVLSMEIGGQNSMEPLVVGAALDLPVVDADGMGRAFPELQMFTPLIYGCETCPAAVADDKGQRAALLQADSPKHLENHFRAVCVEMGCMAGVVFNLLTASEVRSTCILYSQSRAWRLGHTVLRAYKNGISPIQAVLQQENGRLLATGKVSFGCPEDHHQRVCPRGSEDRGVGGFPGETLKIDFQNENLVARFLSDNKVVACVPDLITIVDADSGTPIATEEQRYGLRVAVLVLPAPLLLCTPEALQVVGPQAFGYPEDVIYSPYFNLRCSANNKDEILLDQFRVCSAGVISVEY
uniref:Hydantoinase/oxoprolinase N-terminal domain-containing protein n=1 Tax=Branchiostoma floridae TaxID=7739 RepID=C3YGX6_BRAFL|eukprot:XP_002604436.1 hypothetical protein BRAFLDRAFT_79264 [Branchiostoma floridae]